MSAPAPANVPVPEPKPVTPAEAIPVVPAKALDPLVGEPTFVDKALAQAKPVSRGIRMPHEGRRRVIMRHLQAAAVSELILTLP